MVWAAMEIDDFGSLKIDVLEGYTYSSFEQYSSTLSDHETKNCCTDEFPVPRLRNI